MVIKNGQVAEEEKFPTLLPSRQIGDTAMKSKIDEKSQRLLLLLKLDAKNLFNRIKYRKIEYITILAVKRNRTHFQDIFYTRYNQIMFDSLLGCSTDVITALDQYYSTVEEMKWYLNHTEDMTNTVEDKVQRFEKNLETHYQTLVLYIDAELGIDSALEEKDTLSPQDGTEQ